MASLANIIPLGLYSRLKEIGWLRKSYSTFLRSGTSRMNVLEEFPDFVPNSGGSYKMLAQLTTDCINDVLPCFASLFRAVNDVPGPIDMDAFVEKYGGGDVDGLKEALDRYGSDKATNHNYHIVYASLLKNIDAVRNLMEIGLGTNNTDVASTMGPLGKPGASLRGFRDFLPSANVVGADIDRRILFSEERIQTYWIDQTDPMSFKNISGDVGEDFDLMIDDGLHSINANLNSLIFFFSKIRKGGFAVVEDIPNSLADFWSAMAVVLQPQFDCDVVRARASLMFVCRRVD